MDWDDAANCPKFLTMHPSISSHVATTAHSSFLVGNNRKPAFQPRYVSHRSDFFQPDLQARWLCVGASHMFSCYVQLI